MAAQSGAPIKQTKFAKPGIDSTSALEAQRAKQLEDLKTVAGLEKAAQAGLSDYQKEALKLRERELDLKETQAGKVPQKVVEGPFGDQTELDEEIGPVHLHEVNGLATGVF